LMKIVVNDIELEFDTREGLFSPVHADRGTLAMLSVAKLESGMKVLDLGCGWGLVGAYAAKICGAENIWMCDIDVDAVEAARANMIKNGAAAARICVSDGLKNVDTAGFDVILTNPPYQTDFSVAKSFIEKGFNRLKIGGVMYVVVKRRAWYENKLRAIFGGCTAREIDGYFVFAAEKRRSERSNMKNG